MRNRAAAHSTSRNARFITFIALIATALALPLSTYAQAAVPPTAASGTGFPVTGSGTAPSGPVDFAGTFNIQRFHVTDGKLFAQGLLSGAVTETANGTVTEVPEQAVDIPVISTNGKQLSGVTSDEGEMQAAQAAPGCDILNLVLGPLHLDLLGLVVDLNQVILNITGQTGAGNLLGNLLCAVTGLLDSPGQGGLAGIANLLNRILAVLGG